MVFKMGKLENMGKAANMGKAVKWKKVEDTPSTFL